MHDLDDLVGFVFEDELLGGEEIILGRVRRDFIVDLEAQLVWPQAYTRMGQDETRGQNLRALQGRLLRRHSIG